VIDVRDLSEWMVRVGENGTLGTFNACGPDKKLAWGTALDACKKAGGKEARLHWLSPDAMEKHKDEPAFQGLNMPIWAPATGESKGFHTWSNTRAVKAGLTFRPIDAICADTLAWWNAQTEERRKRPVAGPRAFWLSPEKEAEIIKFIG
jgi:2'-hydroxyisoflavone reductase